MPSVKATESIRSLAKHQRFCDSFYQSKVAKTYVTRFRKGKEKKVCGGIFMGSAKSDFDSTIFCFFSMLYFTYSLRFTGTDNVLKRRKEKRNVVLKVHAARSPKTTRKQSGMTKSGTMETLTLI